MHKFIKFNQEALLKLFIDISIEPKQRDFEEDFFKADK